MKADEEVAQRRLFVLQIVQPGLAGLMDGSVSTLAPVFAAAFATTEQLGPRFWWGWRHRRAQGISMGFAEALSDDGSLTGRGHPWVRGLICGAMTAVGGIGHTLPFLLHDFRMALWAASVVVIAELGVDHLDPAPLYGYPMGFGSSPSGVGRSIGVHHRLADWEFVRIEGCPAVDRVQESKSPPCRTKRDKDGAPRLNLLTELR